MMNQQQIFQKYKEQKLEDNSDTVTVNQQVVHPTIRVSANVDAHKILSLEVGNHHSVSV